ncbi:MAG: transposase [Proteobacteria bacterium]|nr:transposase [Pseudomonadota bacterium]
MTAPRYTKIDLDATRYYHCMTRCVRRSYLCGRDMHTGQDFEHRKGWLVTRIKQLSSIFAIKICAYAVMSNHYHLVLYVNESEAKAWKNNDIIERWAALFPRDAAKLDGPFVTEHLVDSKVALWRERLMSISWFMRCINETIAKFSNEEDNCTGRFWEGRFKSQALLDEGALLATMAYVDLNPIRAKIASTPEESEFTSIYERIKEAAKSINKKKDSVKASKQVSPSEAVAKLCDKAKQPSSLVPFANGNPLNDFPAIDFRLSDYLQLVDTTGRILRENKRGVIPEHLSPILTRLKLTSTGWFEMVKNLEQHFYHAVGHIVILAEFGSQYRMRKPRGTKAAKKCYLHAA